MQSGSVQTYSNQPTQHSSYFQRPTQQQQQQQQQQPQQQQQHQRIQPPSALSLSQRSTESQPSYNYTQSHGRQGSLSSNRTAAGEFGQMNGANDQAGQPADDRKDITRVYWEALRTSLADLLSKEPPNARSHARLKLVRLTKQQFHELTMDVYDELLRRNSISEGGPDIPGLPYRQDFHSRRNEARQKLATLPKNRYKDLASDVFFELNKRNPEFSASLAGETSNERPSQVQSSIEKHPVPNARHQPASSVGSMASSMHSRTMSSSNQPQRQPQPQPQPSQTQHRPSQSSSSSIGNHSFYQNHPHPNSQQQQQQPGKIPRSRQESMSRTISNSSSLGEIPLPSSNNSSLPSNRPRKDSNSSYSPPYSSAVISDQAFSTGQNSNLATNLDENTNQHTSGASAGLLNSVKTSQVVPNKSTIASEEIEVPYSRDSEYILSPRSPEFQDSGAFGRRPSNQRNGSEDHEEEGMVNELKMTVEQLRLELQQARRNHLEEQGRGTGKTEYTKNLEESLHNMTTELEQNKTSLSKEKDKSYMLEAQMKNLGISHETKPSDLQKNRDIHQPSTVTPSEDDFAALRVQIKELLRELDSLSQANDHLHTQVDRERELTNKAEARAKEMERKWRALKTELRNLKATSQMFVSAPRTEDHFPASKGGIIADVHLTVFQDSINSLLATARSSSPSSILGATQPVLAAVSSILRDVELFESSSPVNMSSIDLSTLQATKDKSSTALSALVESAKDFATSYGLSPVGLVDAAARELSLTIVDLFKLLGIRRVDKAMDLQEPRIEEEDGERGFINGENGANRGAWPAVGSARSPLTLFRPFEEEKGEDGEAEDSFKSRQSSASSTYDEPSLTMPTSKSPASGSNKYRGGVSNHLPAGLNTAYRLTSTSSVGSSFDLERKASLVRADSTREYPGGLNGVHGVLTEHENEHEEELEDDGDNAWIALKPYLETQSDALIQSIQTLLSSIRTGATGTLLQEHMSSVIVIGSSIVGVSNDSLSKKFKTTDDDRQRLLKTVAENCESLSELSESVDMSKETRNLIAGVTFDLAKNLKVLMSF